MNSLQFKYMINACVIIVFLLVSLPNIVLMASASPVDPTPFIAQQPDGICINIRSIGDEFGFGYATVNGNYAVKQYDDSYWHYIDSRTGEMSGKAGIDTVTATDYVGLYLSKFDELRKNKEIYKMGLTPAGSGPINTNGDVRLPIILIRFNDTSSTYSPSDIEQLFSGNHPTVAPLGSVHDYYYEASYGQLNLTFGVADHWVVDDMVRSYYNNTIDVHGDELVHDGLDMADQFIDFNQYDRSSSDPNGNTLSCVIILYSGSKISPSESLTHFGRFSSPYETNDGVKIVNWVIVHETMEDNTSITTIGHAVHELGHAFGAPDLYDRTYVTAGLTTWDPMSYGMHNSINHQGDCPSLFSAWTKATLGFTSPTQIINSSYILIHTAESNSTNFQLLDNPNGYEGRSGADGVWLSGSGDFFMIEYRNNTTGFDRSLPGSGLLIWHVNEQKTSQAYWNNYQSNRLLDLEEADGDFDSSDYTDLWYYPYATTFNAISTPNSNLNSGDPSGVSVTGISGIPSNSNDPMYATIGVPLLGYSSKKTHNIPESVDGVLTDYQVQLVVHNTTGTDTDRDIYLDGGSLSWPYDFRFTNADNGVLSYWIESYDSDNATVWVKVDNIAVSPAVTPINVYYGRSGDLGESNGASTFIFFDDFDSLNSSTWDTGWSPVVSGGAVVLDSAGDYVQSKSTFDPGSTALRAKIYSGRPSDYFSVLGYGSYLSGGGWNYMNPDGAYVWFEYGCLGAFMRWFIENSYVNSGYTPFPVDQWHTYDVILNASRNRVYIDMDGVQILSGTSGSSVTSPRKIFFGRHYNAQGTANVSADWVLVRKYTMNEPGQQSMLRMDTTYDTQLLFAVNGSYDMSQSLNNSTIYPGNARTMNDSNNITNISVKMGNTGM